MKMYEVIYKINGSNTFAQYAAMNISHLLHRLLTEFGILEKWITQIKEL